VAVSQLPVVVWLNRGHYKTWTLDWTMDWTMDWTLTFLKLFVECKVKQ